MCTYVHVGTTIQEIDHNGFDRHIMHIQIFLWCGKYVQGVFKICAVSCLLRDYW